MKEIGVHLRHGKHLFGIVCIAVPAVVFTLSGGSPPAVAGGLIKPDPTLTPGATRRVTLDRICAGDIPEAAPAISAALANKVLRRYHLQHHPPSHYVINRLIPLDLGGSDEIDNLWPESMNAVPWSAERKKEVEWQLHFLVCRGALPLTKAQAALASDWIGAYGRYLGAPAGALWYGRAVP